MIDITVYRQGQNIHGFATEGHAQAAPEGQDIVCAAVSAIVQTAVFGLHEIAGFTMECALDPESGRVTRKLPWGLRQKNEQAYHDAQVILATMIVGLWSIANEHTEFVNISEEEIENV
jgi:uncharacterized protein YsxB (DUF464 family)